MCLRWVSGVMAAVMLWFSMASLEAAWAGDAACGSSPGTVLDHHIDDAPSQTAGAAEASLAGHALPSAAWPALLPLAGQRPAAPPSQAWREAPAEGPFRPPRLA